MKNKRNTGEIMKPFLPWRGLGFWLIAGQQCTLFGQTVISYDKEIYALKRIRIKSGCSTLCPVEIHSTYVQAQPNILPLGTTCASSSSFLPGYNTHTRSPSTFEGASLLYNPAAHLRLGKGLPHSAPHHKNLYRLCKRTHSQMTWNAQPGLSLEFLESKTTPFSEEIILYC